MASTVEAAVMSPHVDEPRDQFGGRVSKLSALLELDEGGSALTVGTRWNEWAPELHDRFRVVDRFDSARGLLMPAAPQQLILLDSDALTGLSAGARTELVSALIAALASRGSLVMFTANRFAWRRIVRDPASLFARSGGSRRAQRRMLEEAGASHIEAFLPLPELWDAEEIVGDVSTIALPSHASRLDRLVLATGLFPWLHDGFIHLASHAGGGTRRIRERLAAHIGADPDAIVVERFDLRSRGALVLMARRLGSRTRVVCRVASSAGTDERIRRNAALTARVRDWPGLPTSVGTLLPESLGTFALPSGTAYLESLIEGIVAWKLAVPGTTETRLLRATHAFTRDLGRATARDVMLDAPALDALLDARAAGDPETERRLATLQAALRARFTGRRAAIVLSHGDFGYGNVMSRADGMLAGVIDWDQGRDDLAGVDLVNFLVQRASGMRALPVLQSFRELHELLGRDGLRSLDASLDYPTALSGSCDDSTGLVSWCVLRYVQRSAGYPALFTGFRTEAHALLDWAMELLA